ncbi:hypothetical protein HYT02_05590 [Candidatus Gottesmanbacteria bacterium]|nr:hypothetical protein [Candidatus Gottesmanbacteria bacterium]
MIANIKKNPVFWLLVLLISIITVFFRTFNYLNRIYIYADNALFAQAAYFAFKNQTIPQIGPFAQAPFFTGPWWLWILMVVFVFPFGYLTPWYFMTFVSLIFILLLFIAGKEIGGKWLGLLTAFLGSISTATIDNSFMTWNAAADPILGLISVIFFIKYIKNKRPINLFFLTFLVSLATTIHFETFLLSGLIIVALFYGRPKIKNWIYAFIGGLIAIFPLLYFDLRFNWFWTIRVYEYITIGQSRIFVPNRWLTYAGEFWPQTWAFIIGGSNWLGYFICIIVGIVSFVKLKDIKKNKSYFLLLFAFIISVVMFRYWRGERYFYYTNYAHGFVLLTTSWVIGQIYKFKKVIGLIILSLITIFTVNSSIKNLDPRLVTYYQINNIISQIYNTYPYSNFDIYECPFNGSIISTPVSYIMYYQGRNTLDGLKIGVCNPEFQLSWSEIAEKNIGHQYGYMQKSTENIYYEMTEWWKKVPPSNKSLYK